jgi:protein O-mannosyl-transferase
MSKPNKNIRNTVAKPQIVVATATEKDSSTSSQNYWTWLLAVLAITAFCFFPTLDNAFVNWDDDVNLLENENTAVLDAAHVKAIFTDRVIGNYNPLPVLTLAIERHYVGLEPRLYHIDNLLLHLLATFFVFWILKELGLGALGAAIGALLFGIHPMRVESVAWVTERKDVLLAVFYFPAIYYYIKSIKIPKKRTFYLILTTILFLFALLSKIQAVALPLTMLCIDYFMGRELKIKLVLEKTLFFLLSAAVGLAGIYFLKDNGSLEDVANYTSFDRLLIGFYTLNVYLMKFFVPYEMSPLYPYPGTLTSMFYVAPIGVALFFAAAYWLFKNDKKAWFFGIAFFFFNVVFLLQVLGAGQAFLADRFTYIPYLGFFFIVAYYINDFYENNKSSKNILLGAVVAFVLFSAFKTRQQCDVWQDGGTLWTKALEYYPDSDLPWGNRARFYRENKQDYIRAIEGYNQAIKVKPKAEAHNSRGKTYFDLAGYPDLMRKLNINAPECTKRAIDDYNAALKLDTTFMEKKTLAEVYANRGAAYGRYSQETNDRSYLQYSQRDLEQAMRIDPKNENSFLNGYLVNSELENLPKALECIDKFNALKPGECDMYYERAVTHRRMKDESSAIKDLEEALRLAKIESQSREPKLKERGKLILGAAHNELARIYFLAGDKGKARIEMEAAMQVGFKNLDEIILKSLQ